MRCQDILEKIEARYPRKYACDWDNVGLLAGSRERRRIIRKQSTASESWKCRNHRRCWRIFCERDWK